MDRRKEIAALAESEEERMLLVRTVDRLSRGMEREQPVCSAFLTQREQALVRRLLPECAVWGGTEGTERAVAYWLPEYLTREDYFGFPDGPIACLRGRFYEENALSHRDVLGALMGAGIRRDAVGDIYLRETSFDCFVLSELTRYLLDNLTDAGRQRLRLESIDPASVERPAQEMKELRVSVASLRLDGVLAAAFHLSRGEAVNAVRAGAVAVNGLTCLKPDRPIAENDELSLRGRGKLRVLSLGGATRRGRLALTVGIYL